MKPKKNIGMKRNNLRIRKKQRNIPHKRLKAPVSELVYQVAANRYNTISQQAQMAINISTASVMGYAAIIAAIFASMNDTSEIYRFYADIIIAVLCAVAIYTSFICREILKRSAKETEKYEQYICKIERESKFVCEEDVEFSPHIMFRRVWKGVFGEYDPYKRTEQLLNIAMVIYSFVIITCVANGLYLILYKDISLLSDARHILTQ